MEITDTSIQSYLDSLPSNRIDDIKLLCSLFEEVTGEKPMLWGGSIIGFGDLHYKYKSGLEGDMPLLGLSSRKQAITLYVSYTLEKYKALDTLGKFKIGKSCLYINKVSDINLSVLKQLLIKASNDTLKYSIITVNKKK